MSTLRASPNLAFLFVLVSAACTSTAPRAPEAQGVADAERLLADVAWLADDAQGGRRAGTDDARRAGEWIAERFRALGLEPAGESGYLQRFEVGLPATDGGDSRLVCGAASWSGATNVVPAYCSDGSTATGELVFCGYAVEHEPLGWNDFTSLGLAANDALTGKVALVVRGAPPKRASQDPAAPAQTETAANVVHGDDWGTSTSLFTKTMNCKRRGAVAVLFVEHPSHPEGLAPFDASAAKQSSLPVLLLSGETGRALAPECFTVLERFIDPPTPTGDAVAYPARTVEVRADVERAKGPAFNVLARLAGRDRSRTVVIGAHYDHLGHGGPESMAPGDRAVHNGADDNASGTAVLLELARLFARGPRPDCDIVFAAWSGEELGLLGSKHWTEHPTVELARVEANLNLDMVGRAGAKKLAVLATASAAPFEAWLGELGRKHGFELSLSSSGNGVGGSDHQAFLERKIPALHFFSGVHADYHKPSDDVERFEAAGAAAVTELARDLVLEMTAAGDLVYVEPPKPEGGEAARATPTRSNGTWFGSVPEYGWEGKGVKLAGTSPGSPAEKAGLKAGDVLKQVGDVKIDTMQDFVYALGLYKPGDTVVAMFERDGKEESVRVLLATRAKP